MPFACPHCHGRYLPFGEIFANGAALFGARSPVQCANCDGRSYIALTGRNASGALAILVAGVVLSFPSAVSNALVAPFPAYSSGVIRADIWAVAFLVAFAIFIFASPLQKVERDAPIPPRSLSAFLGTMAFLGALLLYGYYLFRS